MCICTQECHFVAASARCIVFDLATSIAEGACRAKLDTQSSFGGSSLRSSSLRTESSLGGDSTASMTETIDSLDNGDDETGSTSKQPSGTCWPGNTCDNHLHVTIIYMCLMSMPLARISYRPVTKPWQ